MNLELNLDNLRVADETTLGGASFSGRGMTDRSNEPEDVAPPIITPEKPKNLADVFMGLEDMGDDDGLFDNLDDVEYTPVNKQEEAKIETDDSPKPIEPETPKKVEIDQKQTEDKQNDVNRLKVDKTKVSRVKTQSLKIAKNRIYDPEQELEKLKEELRIKNSEIGQLKLQLSNPASTPYMPFDGSGVNLPVASYHLAFMFSSPLIRRLNSNIGTLTQLDYGSEIKNIEKQLKHAKHEIRYKVN